MTNWEKQTKHRTASKNDTNATREQIQRVAIETYLMLEYNPESTRYLKNQLVPFPLRRTTGTVIGNKESTKEDSIFTYPTIASHAE
jgi:hypothetical protein